MMSAPAAKARAEPVRTMALIELEAWNSRRAWFSSVIRGVESALSAFGRLRVTTGNDVNDGDTQTDRKINGSISMDIIGN